MTYRATLYPTDLLPPDPEFAGELLIDNLRWKLEAIPVAYDKMRMHAKTMGNCRMCEGIIQNGRTVEIKVWGAPWLVSAKARRDGTWDLDWSEGR